MKQETIDKLLALADKAFSSQEPPDKFARTAAHEAAHAAASRHSEECADAAALIAANEFVSTLSDAACFTSRITDAGNDRISYERRYLAERTSYEDAPIFPQKVTDTPFAAVMKPANTIAHLTSNAITSSYLSIFCRETEENHRAKSAARYVYRHTYCATRAAYVVSLYAANMSSDPANRQKTFKEMMSKRLNDDLKYDWIEPSLFLKMMCSITLQIIAGLLLAGGIVAIVIGSAGIAAIPLIETVSIGASVALVAAGVLMGGYFSQKETERLEERNERVEELNTIS